MPTDRDLNTPDAWNVPRSVPFLSKTYRFLSILPATITDPLSETPTLVTQLPALAVQSTLLLLSRTVIVLSSWPTTMLDPSRENARERILPPWICFSQIRFPLP